jgi:beta-lactamase regulating signal transducer with metallopeptidase domain
MMSFEVPFEALGLTLVHFCWQGALIAGAARLVGVAAPGLRPGTRYAVHLLALIAMALIAAATFSWEWVRLAGQETIPADVVSFGAAATAAAKGLAVKDVLPWLDTVWALGVIALSARMMGGPWLIHRLQADAVAVPATLAERFERALKAAGLKQVRLRMHPDIDGPFVVGIFRSVVYLPVSAVSALSPDQFDAVLAHELEHIRRADFAWNLLQTAIETLFFYHPAVWWLGKTLRDQRELACDDAAVTVCRDPLTYATALLALEERRPARKAAPTLAMALGGKDGSLLHRVRRVLGDAPRSHRDRPALMAIPLIVAMLAALAVPVAQVSAHAAENSKKQCRIKSGENMGGGSVDTGKVSLAAQDEADTDTDAGAGAEADSADSDESPAAEATDADVEPSDFWSGLSKPAGDTAGEVFKFKTDKMVKTWKIKAKDWKIDADTWKQNAEGWRANSQAWADQARAAAEQARASIDLTEMRRAQAEGLREGAEQARRQAEALADQNSREARALRRASERLARQAHAMTAEAPEAPEAPEAAEAPEAPEAPGTVPPAPHAPAAPPAPPAASAPKAPLPPKAPTPLASLDTPVAFTFAFKTPTVILGTPLPRKAVEPKRPVTMMLGKLPDARPAPIPVPTPEVNLVLQTKTNTAVITRTRVSVDPDVRVRVVVDGRS